MNKNNKLDEAIDHKISCSLRGNSEREEKIKSNLIKLKESKYS